MNLLIVGDKRWNDQDTIRQALYDYNPSNTIVHVPLQSGAALIGKIVAEQLGFRTSIFDKLEDIDLVLAFHNYIRGSRDTMNIIRQADNLKIPYRVVSRSNK